MTKEASQTKTFYITDDNHPNFFIARFSRTDAEVKPELRALKIGDYHNIGSGRAITREA